MRAMWWLCELCGPHGGTNGKWLVKIGSFGTKVGWCFSGGMSERSSERGGFGRYRK